MSKGRSKVGEQTNERRRFMPLWATVFGLAPISKVDESDDPNDALDMEGDGTQCNPMPRWEPYGVMTNPPAKTSAVYFKISEGGIALPWGTTYQGRPRGTKAGDVALYVDVEQSANSPSVRIFAHGSQSATPGQIEIVGRSGASVVIDKDGQVTVIPAAGKNVRLGSGVDADLSAVVIYESLKTQYDDLVTRVNNHTHTVPGVQAGMATLPTSTGTTAAQVLTSAAGSSNVVAKK